MSENEAPQIEDTPTAADTDEPDVDWRKRYEDLQPEYTRKSQRLSELESDRQKWLAHGQENWPDLFEDDDEDHDDDEDYEAEDSDDEPRFLSRSEFEEFKQEQAATDSLRQFARDLKELVGDRTLNELGREAIYARFNRGEIENADDLSKAINGWFEYEDSLRSEGKPTPRTKAPHVPTGGKTATAVKDFSEMSRDEINDYMVDRARSLETQT